MIRKSVLLGAVCAIVMVSTGMSSAFETRSRGDYAVRKLGRGVSNIVLAPIEVVNSIYTVQKHEGEVAAATYGVFQGVVRTVVRFGVGVGEVVTFPVVREPVLYPEFPARGGVINTIFEPHRTHDYPESDEFKFGTREIRRP